MDLTLKQSGSFGRVSSVDVSQLDKINAIPNKTTDNILMDDLCHDDQLYLSALMEYDSSDEEDEDKAGIGSAWSPMISSPTIVMNKRIKRLRPSYAVTLSLEDISYIRPSWGISKGARTIELNSKKELQLPEKVVEKKSNEKSNEGAYNYFLILLTFVVLLLTVPTYVINKRKELDRVEANKIYVNPSTKVLEIYKPNSDSSEPMLKLMFAQGIPRDLKPDQCSCDIYEAETRRYYVNETGDIENKALCFSCLDWAVRANLRVYVEQTTQPAQDSSLPSTTSYCYNIKWQSYDTLQTPLVDCFVIGEEQWFGLGNIQTSHWPLNKLQFDWTALVTNLSSEFVHNEPQPIVTPDLGSLPLGSHVNFSLFSTHGVHINNIKTDFQLSMKLTQDLDSGTKKVCISAACTDRCHQTWLRSDHLDKFRYENNILEYRICTGSSMKSLISRQLEMKVKLLAENVRKFELNNNDVAINLENGVRGTSNRLKNVKSEKMIEKESRTEPISTSVNLGFSEPLNALNESVELTGLPEGIGLIERTIFATSSEFIPTLDGQTLRLYVDNIVKLSLKTSSILLIDTRWETYVGSLKLNVAMFPKAKLLFEILHNKGFKIVLTLKPYIDTGIGINNINQLFDLGRLYSANFMKDTFAQRFGRVAKEKASIKETLIRRQSLFTFENQSIFIGPNDTVRFPYFTKCKESQEGYCVLLDLTQQNNRAWLSNSIKRSNLLTIEADGIQIGGTHPNGYNWDDHYRAGVSELVKTLFYKEKLYILPQYTGDFGYIQLAPLECSWVSLRSVINSVLNLGIDGFSLIHPGSVWGDLKLTNSTLSESFKSPNKMDTLYGDVKASEKSDVELVTRWLQVAVFLPILQFNNIAPIERHGMQELLQNLIKIRKLYIVPELKKNLPFTPLINQPKSQQANSSGTKMPLIRPVWFSQESGETIVMEQFTIGADILVAPILGEGLRQRDIYLPVGYWHDELRQINIRGGKWLRNYPVELNEIAWFTRARR